MRSLFIPELDGPTYPNRESAWLNNPPSLFIPELDGWTTKINIGFPVHDVHPLYDHCGCIFPCPDHKSVKQDGQRDRDYWNDL